MSLFSSFCSMNSEAELPVTWKLTRTLRVLCPGCCFFVISDVLCCFVFVFICSFRMGFIQLGIIFPYLYRKLQVSFTSVFFLPSVLLFVSRQVASTFECWYFPFDHLEGL